MKNNNMKNQSAKVLAEVSRVFGKISANSTCAYLFHQPQMPEKLKKLKKK
ncbi:MAG: cyclic lactone autoinducer peptide [Lachnospiraceae bacterium]|nr:cyclic lactone autoinducer peptide [Lachnospiraceae bacterium]